MRNERGQTSAEYLGALLIVSVVIAAVALTDIGSRIEYHSRVLICRIAGGTDCSDRTTGNPDSPPLQQCITRNSDKSISGSVKVAFFKLEGGLTGVYRVAADGTTWVTIQADAGAGLQFSTPGVDAGDGDVQASSPKGDFSITGKGQFARTWKFGSEGDAHSFIDHMVDKVVAEADFIPDFLQSADDYDPPHQDSDTVYGGVNVSAGVSAGVPGVYGKAGGSVEGGVGAQYYANGDKTYFFRAKAAANVKGGIDFAGGFGANGDGTVTVGITYDKNGNEKTMTVTGIGNVSGGLDFSGTQDGLSGVVQGIEKASVGANSQSGERVEFQSTLDLTKPANRAAARAFIDGIDPLNGSPVDAATATMDLAARFDADAQTNVRVYDLDHSEVGFDVDGTVLGLSAKYASNDADLRDAWFDPGPGAFQHWYDCSATVRD